MIPAGIDLSGMVKPIREDILHIDIPIQHELKNISLYLFKGEYPALIDAGPTTRSSRTYRDLGPALRGHR